ncbi:MAG TPA: glycosyltransferase family 39 protein [Candidatus Sulfotelmatobacter sp.]|nr:glycosyltransferase family 39 protein [Candidatus Sulfotelmatobacter sp.]
MTGLPSPSRAAPGAVTAEARQASRAAMFILALTVFRLMWLARAPYPLYGDEAQYWTWAQALDWGYVSKPPLIAWLIGITTSLVGDNEFGVRVASPICHAVTALMIAELGRRLYDARTGAWSGVLYASLPAVSVSAMLISTDVPLMLFWTMGVLFLKRALDPGGQRWWIGVGVALGLGLLSKYAMAMFVPSAGLYLALAPEHRAVLRTRWPWMALALGLAIYAPNLIWNVAHGGLTYLHTGANAHLGGDLFHPAKLGEFVGSQFGVFGPLLFAVLLFLLVARLGRLQRDPRSWLLAAFALPQLLLIAIEALLSRAHANWAATAYVTATVLVVAWCRARRRLWLVLPVSLGLHVAALAVMVDYHDLARLAGVELTRATDPFHRLRGWNFLGSAVSAQLAQHPGFVLMTDDRMLFAEMAFYVRPRPTQVAWNWQDHPTDQYELTTDIAAVGDRPILYLTENLDPRDVLARFREADPVARITIPLYPGVARRYALFALQGFKG